MKRIAFVSAILLFFITVVSGGDDAPALVKDEPVLTSFKAKEAANAYQSAIDHAEADYLMKAIAAKKAYMDALIDAKKAAVKNDKLQEAANIESKVKALQDDIAKQKADSASVKQGLIVESAVVYADGLFRDETKAVARGVHGDCLRGIGQDGGDLKWGANKWMIMRLQYHGQQLYVTAAVDSSSEASEFTFGGDLGTVWKERLAKLAK